MNTFIKEEKERLAKELENTMKAIKSVQETITIYRKKGEELTAHYNYVKGASDLLLDIEKTEQPEEVKEEVEVTNE